MLTGAEFGKVLGEEESKEVNRNGRGSAVEHLGLEAK